MNGPLAAAAVATLLLAASVSHAQGQTGLHLGWSACPNTQGSLRNVEMGCDPGTPDVYRLYGSFSLATPLADVVAMDGVIDFSIWDRADVPPFWQFQPGSGCNGTGVVLSARPTNSCDDTNSRLLCAADGLACDALVTAYGHGSTVGLPDNRGRLLFTVARPTSAGAMDLPAHTTAEAAHFGFELAFSMDNVADDGAGCAGCDAGVQITWTQAVLYDARVQPGPLTVVATIDDSAPGSKDCVVMANSAVLPARPVRWGRLKSLYR